MDLKSILADSAARFIAMALPPRLMINKKYFPLWEARGYHVTPVHFYEPVPDTRALRGHLWTRDTQLTGLDMNEAGQLDLLDLFASTLKDEYGEFPQVEASRPYAFSRSNPFFGCVDAEILYGMIRHLRPRKILDLGSGYSTYLAAQAIRKNREVDAQYDCELVAVEPHPNPTLQAGFPGLTKLLTIQVQDLPISEFRSLRENDILFLDSSHVLTIGSDVQYEYLEILPILNRGVLVHIHDIFFPAEYPRPWVLDMRRFWTEQYLVHAFLMFNQAFKVVWAGHYMHLKHPEKLVSAIPSYRSRRVEEWPVSLWIKRVEE